MQLKNYQKDAIKDLTRYLELLKRTEDMEAAYRLFWEEKNIRVGFGGLPAYQNMLVPSDTILTQTIAALKNTEHPYRQKMNADFGNRVEIYSKQELLAE